MFKKLFGKKGSVDESADDSKKKQNKLQRAQTVDSGSAKVRTPEDVIASGNSEKSEEEAKARRAAKVKEAARAKEAAAEAASGAAKRRRKKQKKQTSEYSVDASKPLEYPTTPEQIIDYHKQKSFLSQNEEWLIVELNEFECLVDSEEIIKIIAKHSKFFELDPPELWEEFFEFVEDVPSYDEVINYDVWQEFRDKCYPC